MTRKVVIMGAAGRDFHNFNVAFREDPACDVVAFTAAQIPGIAGRRYPAALAGSRYPDGIPILDESELADICRTAKVDEVVFAYSDVEHALVMHRASIALAAGASFTLLGPRQTCERHRGSRNVAARAREKVTQFRDRPVAALGLHGRRVVEARLDLGPAHDAPEIRADFVGATFFERVAGLADFCD